MAASYEIVSIVPRTRYGSAGESQVVQDVTFTTKGHAQTGMVTVPGDDPDADTVHAAVAKRAANIEAIFT
jgi:hypothetical protein